MALITLTEAKAECGVTSTDDDTQITLLIPQALALMEGKQGAARHLEDYARTEIIDGTGDYKIWLAEPARSITSIHVSADQEWTADTLVAATGYRLRECEVERLDNVWPEAQRNTRIIYAAGFASGSEPVDIIRAIRRQVAFMYSQWNLQKKGLDVVKSNAVEGWRQDYREMDLFPPDVLAVLERYRPARL